jgi:hypothetical protein
VTPRVRHQLLKFGSSLCHVRVIQDDGGRPVVIATNLDENPGPSVTNAVERLAQTIEQVITSGNDFDLILYHPPIPGLSTAPYCRVTFGDHFTDVQWHDMSEEEVERDVGISPLPSIKLAADEQLRLAEIRQADEEECQAILVRERASMQIVALDDLPPTDVELPSSYRDANWAQVAEFAEQLLRSGIDPLNRDAVRRETKRRLADLGDAGWVLSLFFDPIVVSLESKQYTNGRHRTHAMRLAGVRTCVIHVEPGYELPASMV